jgi:ABC-2 type transport system ATP-binding protein
MIQIENLNFSYGKNSVFNNLSLTLEPGRIYGLLGENGVGKTTLLKIMSGLLFPDNGKCIADSRVPSKREPEFLSSICFLPEDIYSPNIKVNEYASKRGSFYPTYSHDLFLQYMDLLETDPGKRFGSLSFGQKKKAHIAFSFASGTKYIFMDEPGNGLDIPSKTQFRKIITSAADDNTCIVISTHQVRDLENIIDPIIILDKNQVLLNASIEKIGSALSFKFNERADSAAIYNEQTPGGYISVSKNTDGEEQVVNIEALFNCVINNKKIISEIFNK